jgi:hypothetical protein
MNLTVVLNMVMVTCGQTVGTFLARLYYNSGGNSKWMATVAVCGGVPLLVIPLLQTPAPSPEAYRPAASKMVAIYAGLGILIGLDNALLYVPACLHLLAGVRHADGLQRRHVAPHQRPAVHGAHR